MTAYTPPSYVTDKLNANQMDTRNRNYDIFVNNKNTFLNSLYSDYKTNYPRTVSTSSTSSSTSSSTPPFLNDIVKEPGPLITYKSDVSTYKSFLNENPSTISYLSLLDKSKNVQDKRIKMDSDISRLNSSRNVLNNNDAGVLHNSYFYVNLLWIILATCLIYYIFTEL